MQGEAAEAQKKFLYASGFSEPFREKLIAAATRDMRRQSFAEWRKECKDEWEAIYKKRGDTKDPMAYVHAVRTLHAWGKDAEHFDANVKESRDAAGGEYDVHVARLYTGIFQHLRDSPVQMCGNWKDTRPSYEEKADEERYCEFRRFCGERQSSDVRDRACADNEALWWCAPPMHFEFAAAITIAVVRFVIFACTFSFVGLPSYDAARSTTHETETGESVPVAIVARTAPERAHLDYGIASCKGVLSTQALRFLVRILRSEYEHKTAVFQYITGIHMSRVTPIGVSVRPATQALGIDEAARLVHWCAGHKLKRGSEINVRVYAGDALLLSAKHGDSMVVLARTKYKTNERNEMCVVHVESATSALTVDSNVRGLVVDALKNGRLGLVCPNYSGWYGVDSAEKLVKRALGKG